MKIAILGSAPSSNLLAPFSDKSWDIWACSPANAGQLPRVDSWFEIHDMERLLRDPGYGGYMLFLRSQPLVYMLEKHPKFPTSVRYPIEEIRPQFCWDFFTSSVAYMLALAISREPTHIGLWGIDMSGDEEYTQQRAGCKYFIDIARQRGIEIVVPKESDLLSVFPPYAYREIDPTWVKLNTRMKELDAEIESLQGRIASDSKKLTAYLGARDMLEWVLRAHVKVW